MPRLRPSTKLLSAGMWNAAHERQCDSKPRLIERLRSLLNSLKRVPCVTICIAGVGCGDSHTASYTVQTPRISE